MRVLQTQSHATRFGLVCDVGRQHLEHDGVADRIGCRSRFIRRRRHTLRACGHAVLHQQLLGAELVQTLRQRHACGGRLLAHVEPAIAAAALLPQQERRECRHRDANVFKHRHTARAHLLALGGRTRVDGNEEARIFLGHRAQVVGHAIEHVARRIHHHRIDRIGLRQRFHGGAHKAGIVHHVARHVDRVRDHAVVGNAGAQGVLQRLRQCRNVEALADELVRQNRAERAGDRDDRHALARALVAVVGTQIRELRHLHKIIALNDVELTECGLVDLLIARQRRGVRAHGFRALFGLAGLVENQQLVAARKLFGRGDEALAVAQLFDVAHADLRAIVLREVFEILREVHAGFVAGVDEVAEIHTQAARDRIHRSAHVAALREQAHRTAAALHWRGVEHRCEVGVHLAVQVRKAHQIRAGHDHVGGGHVGFEFILQLGALAAFFGKARGVDQHGARALGVAALEHGGHIARTDRQHHQIGGLRQRFDVRIAALAKHFFVLGIDRKNLALVAKLRQMRDRHAADARGVVAGANDGDRCRVQQRLEAVGIRIHFHGRQHRSQAALLLASGFF